MVCDNVQLGEFYMWLTKSGTSSEVVLCHIWIILFWEFGGGGRPMIVSVWVIHTFYREGKSLKNWT